MASKPANAEQNKWMDSIAHWAHENIHVLYGNEITSAIMGTYA